MQNQAVNYTIGMSISNKTARYNLHARDTCFTSRCSQNLRYKIVCKYFLKILAGREDKLYSY